MQEKEVRDCLIALLRAALNEVPLDTSVKQALTPDMLARVYRLAKKHDVAPFVSSVAYLSNVALSEEWSKTLQRDELVAVYRCEQMKLTLAEIGACLDEAHIPYVPLKGSVLRPYYPLEHLRTSCDIDVLVRETDLEAAVAALKQKGYGNELRNYHDVSLYSPHKIHLELHFSLREKDAALDAVLQDAWDFASPSDRCCHVFSKEFFAFHIVAHMAHHFLSGGCGIRPLMDIWVMEHKMGIPCSCARAFLQKAGIDQFAEKMSELAAQCFTTGDGDALSDTVLSYIFRGGVYGSTENHIAVKKSTTDTTAGYAMRRLFPPYRTMVTSFPLLSKAPFLLPFCWIARGATLLFGGKTKKALAELSTANTIDDSKVDEMRRIRSHLGL